MFLLVVAGKYFLIAGFGFKGNIIGKCIFSGSHSSILSVIIAPFSTASGAINCV